MIILLFSEIIFSFNNLLFLALIKVTKTSELSISYSFWKSYRYEN